MKYVLILTRDSDYKFRNRQFQDGEREGVEFTKVFSSRSKMGRFAEQYRYDRDLGLWDASIVKSNEYTNKMWVIDGVEMGYKLRDVTYYIEIMKA